HLRAQPGDSHRDGEGMSAVATSNARFINRELSWLAFNERVLEEAEDQTNLPLDRVKFAAIVGSNLDEFFMVRVAALRHAVAEDHASPDPAGRTPNGELVAVSGRAQDLVRRLYGVAADLLSTLESAGIRLVSWPALQERQREALGQSFRDEVLPVLTPLAIDMSRPFPILSSLSVNLAFRLASTDAEPRLAIVQVPAVLTRLVKVAAPASFILLEQIIAAHVSELVAGQTGIETAVFRLARH